MVAGEGGALQGCVSERWSVVREAQAPPLGRKLAVDGSYTLALGCPWAESTHVCPGPPADLFHENTIP